MFLYMIRSNSFKIFIEIYIFNFKYTKNVPSFASNGGTKNSPVSKFCANRDRTLFQKSPISLFLRLLQVFSFNKLY